MTGWLARGGVVAMAVSALTCSSFLNSATAQATEVPVPTPAPATSEVPADVVTVEDLAPVTDPVEGTEWGDISAAAADGATNAAGDYVARRDVNSMYNLTAENGIQDAWREGLTGKGVTVAVIDTGFVPVEGLTGPRVLNGPDLSFEAWDPELRYLDGFGHGTHMAGIVGGRDAAFDPSQPDPRVFAGVAPDSQLLNMRVGMGDGGVDVSQVIASLNWLTQHGRDNGMNVRVVSLAYGTMAVQPWQRDPLAKAVEDAWRAGIVVVAAAGNDGLETDQLLMPAVDPHVLAVGAVDPEGTADPSDDVVADFTNGGNAERRADVLAPGKSVVSLRVPGSFVDEMHPEGRVLGDDSGRFFRGSGTSQATAFAAGQVALLLQQRPDLTPDQVKALLVETARPLTDNVPAAGAGVIDVLAATRADVPAATGTDAPWSDGSGTLEASRGDAHVVDPVTGAVLAGEIDAQGEPWTGPATWQDGRWNNRTWTGTGFVGQDWQYAPWTGLTWWAGATENPDDQTWEGSSWRDDSWEGSSWRGSSWRGSSWRGSSWRGSSWRGSSWRGSSWRGSSWRDDSWEGSSWRGSSWRGSSWRGSSWRGSSWRGASW